MGKFEKHIGKGEAIEINGEEFILKPLGTEFIPDFFKAMKAFSGAKEGATPEELLKNIDDNGLKSIQKIIDTTLEKSFPDEPEEERNQFGLKYMSLLIGKIFEINSSGVKDVGVLKKIETLKRLKENRDAQSDSKA